MPGSLKGSGPNEEPKSACGACCGCISILVWPAGRAAAGKSQDTTTLTGISRSLNPAISINGLFLRAASKNQREDDPAPGFFVQEFELQATAFIGPTVKGNLIIGREGENNEFEFDLEEGYFDIFGIPTALMPAGVTNQIAREPPSVLERPSCPSGNITRCTPISFRSSIGLSS